MRVHFYDFLNKNKIAQFTSEDFTSITVTQHIDDFSTCTISHTFNDSLNRLSIQGFENIYVEDDYGNIIFGGVLVSLNVNRESTQMTIYDHRWVFSRLVLDSAITISSADQILDKVAELVAVAKSKRSIPLEFDLEASAINLDYTADLHFEIGDDVASCLQKIIQTVYARWAVEYRKNGNEITGSLRIRSVRGVTPEGIGISRGFQHSEDGEIVTLSFEEGGESNTIESYDFNYDMTSYASRAKLGVKLSDVGSFYTAPPDNTSGTYEYYFGRTERYVTDYRADSVQTALAVSTINQEYPKIDLNIVLSPKFETYLRCGDRVNVRIVSPMVSGITGNLVRIDAITLTVKDGFIERRILANFMSPQKRKGTIGLLETISNIGQRLDGLDKNYLNS